MTRNTFSDLRGLEVVQISGGNYLCDGGAERLILEYKVQRGRWLDRQAGIEQEPMALAFDNLLRKAGSSNFHFERIPGMSLHEEHLLLKTLAPFESDGPEDTDEWNLFKKYLPDDDENNLHDRHSLSHMLGMWEADQVSR